MITSNKIILYYQYFYSKKYGNEKYIFKPTQRALKLIEDHTNSIDKRYKLETLSSYFLTVYFTFQFSRVENQVFQRFSSKTKTGEISKAGRIQIQDIVGKKALEYWFKRDVNQDWRLIVSEFAKKYQLSIAYLENIFKGIEISNRKIRSEEIEKQRFHNTERGFINCIEKTTLFNSKSELCLLCNDNIDCKKLLKINYPNIYQNRFYI